MDAIATCQICMEDYDDDPSIADRDSSHLPVQSARCPHRVCYSCVKGMKMEKAVKLDKDPCDIKWMACPMCRMKTCFNTEGPVVDLSLCRALAVIRAKDDAIAAKHSIIVSQAARLGVKDESKGRSITALEEQMEEEEECTIESEIREEERSNERKVGEGGGKGGGTQRRAIKAFEKRLIQLEAYKAKHGQLNVKRSKDKSLYMFCVDIRRARRNPERRGRGTKLDDERIAALDAIGFDWAPKMGRSFSDAFEERLKALMAYKAKHGHTNVTRSEDKGLAEFCYNIRAARKGNGRGKLTEERIASLDNLGFDWELQKKEKSFAERVEELKAYKAKHGNLKVKKSEDKSLARFCSDARRAHRGDGTMAMTKERMVALSALGFEWKPQKKKVEPFDERLKEVKAYKAKHGHVNVRWSEDKSLYNFCNSIRQARRGNGKMKLTEERTTSLDAIGFEWGQSRSSPKSFQERVAALKAYKARHGHLDVKRSEDKSLYEFCADMRCARRGIGSMKMTKERIAALNALGFKWAPRNREVKSFLERIEELKAYKAEHGHLNIRKSKEKSLYGFCQKVRQARRNPEKSGRRKLTKEDVASLDNLGFDWAPRGESRAKTEADADACKKERDAARQIAEANAYGEEQSTERTLCSPRGPPPLPSDPDGIGIVEV